MNLALGPYTGLIIPGVLAVVALYMVVKVASAAFKVVMTLVLLAALGGGYVAYQRISPLVSAASAAAYQGRSGMTTASALARAVGTPARQAIADTGLNPAYVRIHVTCGPNTQVQFRYADEHYLFGLLSKQWIQVPMDSSARC